MYDEYVRNKPGDSEASTDIGPNLSQLDSSNSLSNKDGMSSNSNSNSNNATDGAKKDVEAPTADDA